MIFSTAHLGVNGSVRWYCAEAEASRTCGSEYLHVEESGALVATASFDREARARLRITVEARDGGSPPRAARVSLDIRVTDRNDNAPAFLRRLQEKHSPQGDAVDFAVIEGHHSVPLPFGSAEAADADEGANGQLTYTLHEIDCVSYVQLPQWTSGAIFSIDQHGVLSARGSLDREKKPFHCLNITATDAGAPPLGNLLIVRVAVLDVNDNVPRLLSNRTLHVCNTVAGSQVALLHAADADAGENGTLHFRLASSAGAGDLFAVDSRSGSLVLVREALQRDEGTHRLLLNVSDAGTPSLSAVEELLVVIDRQSFAPAPSASDAPLTPQFSSLGAESILLLLASAAVLVVLSMLALLLVALVLLCKRLRRPKSPTASEIRVALGSSRSSPFSQSFELLM